MSTLNDGGPAFPGTSDERYFTSPGMTLRDYFAGQAVINLMTADVIKLHGVTPHVIAGTAYEIADAMLKAKEAAK